MENPIIISWLNDFIFCPASIYFHQLYGEQDKMLYQCTDQINGTNAHSAVDDGRYSSRKNVLQSVSVYSEQYGLVGKIDVFDVDTGILTERKKKITTIYDGMEGNVLLRRHQYAYNDIEIGKHIILNKVANQRKLLERQRNKSVELKNTIAKMKELEESIIGYQGNLAGILGVEGAAARMYFPNHFNNIHWCGRQPRIKLDYVNSVLDIGYTLLFNFIDALLNVYGFDTYCGVLHREFYMRKSLVCDLVEPFRVLIDDAVKKAINLEQCKEEDFTLVNGKYLLEWKHNPYYVNFLMKPLLEHKNEIFLYVQGYYRAFMKQKSAKNFPVFNLE